MNRRWCRAVEALRAYGAQSLHGGPADPRSGARAHLAHQEADFEYHPGATDISTPLADVFAGKAGVCQDFAHVEIAALARHGLAAALRLGLHPHRPFQGRDRAARRRRQPRLGGRVVRRGRGLDPSRPDQRPGRAARTMSPSPGAATSPTSARCAASSWAATPHSYGVAVTLVPTG